MESERLPAPPRPWEAIRSWVGRVAMLLECVLRAVWGWGERGELDEASWIKRAARDDAKLGSGRWYPKLTLLISACA